MQGVQINENTSDWVFVSSRTLKESVLAPLQFIIYINYIDCRVLSCISKFNNDTKAECHIR